MNISAGPGKVRLILPARDGASASPRGRSLTGAPPSHYISPKQDITAYVCEQLVLQEQQLLFTGKIAVVLKRPLFSQPFGLESSGSCQGQGQSPAQATAPIIPGWNLHVGAEVQGVNHRGPA